MIMLAHIPVSPVCANMAPEAAGKLESVVTQNSLYPTTVFQLRGEFLFSGQPASKDLQQ